MYICENNIVKKNFDNIQNKTAGPINLTFFQDKSILIRIESIRLYFLKNKIIGDKGNIIDNNIPGIINNTKPNCIMITFKKFNINKLGAKEKKEYINDIIDSLLFFDKFEIKIIILPNNIVLLISNIIILSIEYLNNAYF